MSANSGQISLASAVLARVGEDSLGAHGAEVADRRGVGEQVERLGRQRAERRKGEPQDLPVVLRAPPEPPRAARCRAGPGA